MDFLSPAQCRAARGLLNWSQPDLANKSGMHVQTICAFENETGTPTKSTLEKMTKAFEYSGIEFSGSDGVQRKQDIIRKYEGHNLGYQILDEIYNDLKHTGGEILLKGVSERKWYDTEENTKFLDNHIKRLN
jgi:transcriptional regulator with XRE-family HTH domain